VLFVWGETIFSCDDGISQIRYILGLLVNRNKDGIVVITMKNIHVIIVSMPGTSQRMLQNSIEANLSAEVIGIVHGGLCAIQSLEEHNPDLLLVDSSIPNDEAVAIVRNVKQQNPEIMCVVITDTAHQRHRVTEAGADFTLSSFNFEPQLQDILKKNETGWFSGPKPPDQPSKNLI
jgi:chemotaxis response regulator CheB